jgi:polyisoprenoid-binding protein YceI
MFMRYCIALLLVLACACAHPETRVQTLALDSARSRVDFEVKVLWLVGVHGRFNHVQGTIAIDHFRNSATVDARIDAGNVSMRSKGHEDWVKSPEFFDAQHYPTIEFVSEAIPLRRLQLGGAIEGMLTLRGITRKVSLQIQEPNCPAASGDDCPVEAVGTIRRGEFGMQSRHGTLSDKVELSFAIYLHDTEHGR